MVERDGAGAVIHEYSRTYDHNDKATSLTESVNGRSLHYVYAYNADQVAEGMSGDVGRHFTYDGFGRTTAVTGTGMFSVSNGISASTPMTPGATPSPPGDMTPM